MASGFTLFGKEFIMAWVGKDFVTSYYIAVILILPLCVPLIQNLGISIMQAKQPAHIAYSRTFCFAAVGIYEFRLLEFRHFAELFFSQQR